MPVDAAPTRGLDGRPGDLPPLLRADRPRRGDVLQRCRLDANEQMPFACPEDACSSSPGRSARPVARNARIQATSGATVRITHKVDYAVRATAALARHDAEAPGRPVKGAPGRGGVDSAGVPRRHPRSLRNGGGGEPARSRGRLAAGPPGEGDHRRRRDPSRGGTSPPCGGSDPTSWPTTASPRSSCTSGWPPGRPSQRARRRHRGRPRGAAPGSGSRACSPSPRHGRSSRRARAASHVGEERRPGQHLVGAGGRRRGQQRSRSTWLA